MSMGRRLVGVGLIAATIFCAAPVVAGDAATSIPFKSTQQGESIDIVRLGGGFVLCLLLLAGIVHVMRRYHRIGVLRGATQKKLNVLEARRLNPRATLYVIEFAGTHHLLAHSEQGIQSITTAPIPPEQPGMEQPMAGRT